MLRPRYSVIPSACYLKNNVVITPFMAHFLKALTASLPLQQPSNLAPPLYLFSVQVCAVFALHCRCRPPTSTALPDPSLPVFFAIIAYQVCLSSPSPTPPKRLSTAAIPSYPQLSFPVKGYTPYMSCLYPFVSSQITPIALGRCVQEECVLLCDCFAAVCNGFFLPRPPPSGL